MSLVNRALVDTVASVYEIVLYSTGIIALYSFRKVDRPTKMLCIWIFLGCVTEMVASYAAVRYGINLQVYSVYSLIEIMVLAFYFNFSVSYLRRKKIVWYIVVAAGLLWIVNVVWLQSLYTLNSNFIFFGCLTVVCQGLYAIYDRLINYDKSLSPETHFWIPCLFIVYQCGLLWNWGAYNYFLTYLDNKAFILIISVLIINLLVCLSFAALLLLYPKMKRSYVF